MAAAKNVASIAAVGDSNEKLEAHKQNTTGAAVQCCICTFD